MTTEFDGGPVLGGTFPALIWHDFMISALQIEKERGRTRGATQGLHRPERSRSRSSSTAEAETGRLHHRDDAEPGGPDRPGSRQGRRKSATPGGGSEAATGAPKPAKPEHTASPAPAAPASPEAPSRTVLAGSVRAGVTDTGASAVADGRRQPRGLDQGGSDPARYSGLGRETWRLPPTAKRQGSSTAFVIPIRVPATTWAQPRRLAREDADGPVVEIAAVLGQLDAERLGQLAGPRAEILVAHRSPAGARRARIGSIPSSGSSARIRTAAPTPSASQTALSSAWMP